MDNIVQLTKRQDGKPTIVLVDGELFERVFDDAQEAVRTDTANPPVFQRGGVLVYLQRIPTTAKKSGIRRPAGASIITLISQRWLQRRLAKAARFTKFNFRRKKEVPREPPMDLAASLVEAGEWRFPPLEAVIEAPTLRPDGSVLIQPGYDENTGLFFDPGAATFPPVPEAATQEDARAALMRLCDVLSEFPFVDKTAQSVALAAILTVLVRRSLRTSPLFIFDAPVMGSGKTLLADVTGLIATGRTLPAMSYTSDEAEERKRITAALSAGDPVMLIDNVGTALKGDTLSAVLTQEMYKDRILGMTKMVVLPTSTVWIATGNNVAVMGDLCSRVLLSRIDPGCEQPEERKFERPDLRAYVRAHRGELVHAGLTVLRAYVVAGRPRQDIKAYGRFEEWSDLVRSSLVWLNCTDPCMSREILTINDTVRASLAAVLAGWKTVIGLVPVTSVEVIRMATQSNDRTLQEALEAALFKGELKPHPLGRWLARHLDRVVNGMALQQVGERKNGAIWRLKA